MISFAQYKEYMICLISFSQFSDMLPAFTLLWGICLGVNTFRLECSESLSEKPVPSIFIGNILLSKALRTLSLPSKGLYKFSRSSPLCFFFSEFLLSALLVL